MGLITLSLCENFEGKFFKLFSYANIFLQNLNNNRLDLPITKFGSKRNILIFKIFAARQCGILIYPPVDSSNFGFSFFRKNKDFKNETIKKKGNIKMLKFFLNCGI